jgi:CRP/FNR family cyclic AMP-dependent transcriptional regulator
MKSISELLLAHPRFKEGEQWVRRSYPANKAVITEGECGKELFVVMRGTVRVTGNIELEGGNTIHPGFCDLGAGAVFGEFGALIHSLRSATVNTVTDCELAVIDGDRLYEFFETDSSIGYQVMLEMLEAASERLTSTNRRTLTLLAWGLEKHDIERHL